MKSHFSSRSAESQPRRPPARRVGTARRFWYDKGLRNHGPEGSLMNDVLWHSLDAGEALRTLASDGRKGLDEAEVARRLAQYGPNELKKEEKASPWSIFLGQFKNILIIILLVATVLSAAVGEIFDAVLIFVIVVF